MLSVCVYVCLWLDVCLYVSVCVFLMTLLFNIVCCDCKCIAWLLQYQRVFFSMWFLLLLLIVIFFFCSFLLLDRSFVHSFTVSLFTVSAVCMLWVSCVFWFFWCCVHDAHNRSKSGYVEYGFRFDAFPNANCILFWMKEYSVSKHIIIIEKIGWFWSTKVVTVRVTTRD